MVRCLIITVPCLSRMLSNEHRLDFLCFDHLCVCLWCYVYMYTVDVANIFVTCAFHCLMEQLSSALVDVRGVLYNICVFYYCDCLLCHERFCFLNGL